MQYPSPAQSSPSNGFFSARASPLFSSVDQPDPVSDLPQAALVSSGSAQERDHAPPQQLAHSLECLNLAIRQVSDIRGAADEFLDGLDVASWRKSKETGEQKTSDDVKAAFQQTRSTLESLRANCE